MKLSKGVSLTLTGCVVWPVLKRGRGFPLSCHEEVPFPLGKVLCLQHALKPIATSCSIDGGVPCGELNRCPYEQSVEVREGNALTRSLAVTVPWECRNPWQLKKIDEGWNLRCLLLSSWLKEKSIYCTKRQGLSRGPLLPAQSKCSSSPSREGRVPAAGKRRKCQQQIKVLFMDAF